jgi:hypothetical protein
MRAFFCCGKTLFRSSSRSNMMVFLLDYFGILLVSLPPVFCFTKAFNFFQFRAVNGRSVA